MQARSTDVHHDEGDQGGGVSIEHVAQFAIIPVITKPLGLLNGTNEWGAALAVDGSPPNPS